MLFLILNLVSWYFQAIPITPLWIFFRKSYNSMVGAVRDNCSCISPCLTFFRGMYNLSTITFRWCMWCIMKSLHIFVILKLLWNGWYWPYFSQSIQFQNIPNSTITLIPYFPAHLCVMESISFIHINIYILFVFHDLIFWLR